MVNETHFLNRIVNPVDTHLRSTMPRTFSPAPDDADEACTKCLGRKSTKSNPMVLCDAAGCLNGVSV